MTTLAVCVLTTPLFSQTREEKRLFETAQRAFNDGIYEVAEINSRKLLGQFPNSEFTPQARLTLAQALVLQSEGALAVTVLTPELSRQKSPLDLVEVKFTLAEAYTLAEKWKEAAALYQAIIDDPKAGDYALKSRYSQAWLEYLSGNTDAAVEKFMMLGEENRKNETGRKSLLTLAKIQLQLDQSDLAEKTLAPLITDNPLSPLEFEALFWRAEIYAARGQHEEARKIFESITINPKAQPQSVVGDAWLALGDVYTSLNDDTDAAKAYEQAFQKALSIERRSAAMKRYSQAMAKNRQVQPALDKLREFSQKNLESRAGFEADVVLAGALYQQKMFPEALAECRRILTSPAYASFDLAKVYELAADCYVLNNQTDEALKMLRGSLKTATREDQRTRMLFKIADLLLQQKNSAGALDIYQQISKEFPRGTYAEASLFRQGQAHALAGNSKAAITAYQSLLTQFPDSAFSDAAQFETANIYFLAGQFVKAREVYDALVKNFPKSPLIPKAQFALAECLFREEKYPQAAAAFTAIAKNHPKNQLAEQALYNHCLTLAKMGDENTALDAFNQFVERYPKSDYAASATFWLGNYYYNRQDYARAQSLFEQLSRNFPAHELIDESYYWAAKSAAGRQETTKANELYQKVASIPNSPLRIEARLRQAELQRQLNQFANALLIYESILKETGQTPPLEARLGKGICLQQLKKYEEAIKVYEEIRQLNQGNLTLHNETTYRIGKCLQKLGKNKEALTTYMDIIYAKSLPDGLSMDEAAKLPEFVWFSRAGFDAGEIKEEQQDWKGAIQIYKILEVAGGPKTQDEARDRKVKLQTEHFIYEE